MTDLDTTNARTLPSAAVAPGQWRGAATIRVGVVDEHEIFALGLRICLAGHPIVKVLPEPGPDMDVAIVSPEVAAKEGFACPLVVCGEPPKSLAAGNVVLAALPRATLTAEQLLASVHAAASGLRISPLEMQPAVRLHGRGREVLGLLAAGASTQEIAQRLNYSERTIKSVIRELQVSLGARNRTQVVGEAIRQGLI